MDYLDETLSATHTTSKEINGSALVPYAERGERKAAAVQVIPLTENRNSLSVVVLQGGINTPTGTTFSTIASFSILNPTMRSVDVFKGCNYRFLRTGGGDVRVIMRG